MSSDDDGLFPSRDEPWDILDDNRFSKHGSVENVSDGSIGAFPHFLKLELLNSGLIGGDGGAFNSDFALFDSLSSFNGDLVISSISVLHSKIKVLNLDVEERENEVVFDGLPDDSGHLVTIEFSDRVGDFDFSCLHEKDIVVNRYAKIEYINKNLSPTLTISDEDKIYFLLTFCFFIHIKVL